MKTKTKQTTRTGTESQKWRSYGGLSVGRVKGENGRKGIGNKKHNWQAKVKNGIAHREIKELICTTHGHELRGGGMLEGGGVKGRGG